MEKVIFFGLVIPIFIFVLYLGSRAIMTGFNARSSNRINSEIENNEEVDNISNNSQNLTNELDKLNKLFKDGVLTQEEFEKAKKKLLDN